MDVVVGIGFGLWKSLQKLIESLLLNRFENWTKCFSNLLNIKAKGHKRSTIPVVRLHNQNQTKPNMDSKSVQLFMRKNEKLPIVTKSSDFSIDHILNKAGNVFEKKPINLNTSMDLTNRSYNDTTDKKYLLNDLNEYPPILNWLHYTRYRPPRIPRKPSLKNQTENEIYFFSF